MADYSCVYVLNTPSQDIRFNDGVFGNGSSDDLFWISVIHGLDDAEVRGTPVKDKPFDDGGIVGRTWDGPLFPIVEGNLIVQSVGAGQCQAIFNAMEEDLRQALAAIKAPTSGTLEWTPAGGSAESLTVYKAAKLVVLPTDSYQTRSFTFGLASTAESY